MPTAQYYIFFGLTVAVIASVHAGQVMTKEQAYTYLIRFGYLHRSASTSANGSLVDKKAKIKALQNFQRFVGLNVTGEVDDETKNFMSKPRCVAPDMVGFGSSNRSKRYVLQGSRWRVKDLTYRISKYTEQLERAVVDKVISRAFAVWSNYTDLKFTQKTTGPVHFDIKFTRGNHFDGKPFDNMGGSLAHAFFPEFGGDIHFDDDEIWTTNFTNINLFLVATHEFGHALGLEHSSVPSSIMTPIYKIYFHLDSDDVLAIQALYGKKSTHNANSMFPFINRNSGEIQRPIFGLPPVPTNLLLCSDTKIDTIFKSADGQIYVFKDNIYYKLTDKSVAFGYPKPINVGWPGLPGNIDAAFTYTDGKTYFFKGKQFWRYSGRQLDDDYPQDISAVFVEIPNDLDAAVAWDSTGTIYFFKGNKFWPFILLPNPHIYYGHTTDSWEGLPHHLDAALKYTREYTYFFKGDKYYRVRDSTFSVSFIQTNRRF